MGSETEMVRKGMRMAMMTLLADVFFYRFASDLILCRCPFHIT